MNLKICTVMIKVDTLVKSSFIEMCPMERKLKDSGFCSVMLKMLCFVFRVYFFLITLEHIFFLIMVFYDWQHLNPYITDHKKFWTWKKNKKSLLQKKKEKWCNVLKIKIDVILFCSKNNLGHRGTTDKLVIWTRIFFYR